MLGFCFGNHNCKPERKLGRLYNRGKCNVDEKKDERCKNDYDCMGD